jgi:hypothetical protein
MCLDMKAQAGVLTILSCLVTVTQACGQGAKTEAEDPSLYAPRLKGAIEGPIGPQLYRGSSVIDPPVTSSGAAATEKAYPVRLMGATNGTIGPKRAIETPVESSLYRRSSLIDRPASLKVLPSPRISPDVGRMSQMGPKERPGLITWHKNIAEACAASARTRKPVLLVHVLGNLDDHFC